LLPSATRLEKKMIDLDEMDGAGIVRRSEAAGKTAQE